MSDLQNLPPIEWQYRTINEFALQVTDGDHHTPHRSSSGVLLLSARNIYNGRLNLETVDYVSEDEYDRMIKRCYPEPGDILISCSGSIGRVCVVPNDIRCVLVRSVALVKLDPLLTDSQFIGAALQSNEIQRQIAATQLQAAQPNLFQGGIKRLTIHLPPLPQQKKIARILTTVDNLIEKTEALIEKYNAIKQGMMHDLFARGVDQNGKLRPPYEEAPHLYKESPLGWIPKEWECELIGNVIESAIDGPFGSNLKTAHYVDELGVRVIRLQNIDATRYDDADKAFISESHAQELSRHKVIGGDVVVAALGEERHPVGRACLYPKSLPPAINKADCFRIRCNKERLSNHYFMLWLNTEFVQPEIQRFRQGVTLQRINLSNIKRISIPVPSHTEQHVTSSRLQHIDDLMDYEEKRSNNLNEIKAGLMQDLLTGKVRVNLDENEQPNDPSQSVLGGVGP